MLFAVLIIGFLFLGLALKLAKGVIKIVLIIVIIALMAGGSAVTTTHTEVVPVSSNL